MDEPAKNAAPSSLETASAGQAGNAGSHSSEVALIYTTFPSKSEAKNAGRALIESGTAACVNIFPKMTSLYIWEGEVQESREAAMLIKTAKERGADVLAEVKRLHPYSLPARLLLAVDGGGDDFLRWICDQSGLKASL